MIERCLEKEPGHRYQRASEVRTALEAVETQPSSSSAVSAAATSPTPAKSRLWLPAVIVLAAALFAANFGGLLEKAIPSLLSPGIHSLAVLPLENLSGDPKQQYFADDTTGELTSELSQAGALRVVSRLASLRNSCCSLRRLLVRNIFAAPCVSLAEAESDLQPSDAPGVAMAHSN